MPIIATPELPLILQKKHCVSVKMAVSTRVIKVSRGFLQEFRHQVPCGNMAAATIRPSSFKMLNVEVALAVPIASSLMPFDRR